MSERGREQHNPESQGRLSLVRGPSAEAERQSVATNRNTEIFQFAEDVSRALTVDDAVAAGMELVAALTMSPRPGVNSEEFTTELLRNRIDQIRAEQLRGDLTRLEEQVALATEDQLHDTSLLWRYAKLRKLRRDTVLAEPEEQRRIARRFEFLEERLFNKSAEL